jgi:protein-disulfide isomerase
MDINKLAIPIAIIIAGGLVAGSLYLSNANGAKLAAQKTADAQAQQASATGPIDMRPVSADDHILGNPNADLVIVEYSDTECPYCKVFHQAMQQAMSEYGKDGKVAWVYRHFPISQLHSKAPKEAEATECANELGGPAKFWEFTNMVYAQTNSNNSLDPAQLPVFAKAVGLDVKAFNTCLASGKYAAKVQADYTDAVKSGGRGTPHSIFITKDGTKTPVDGALPYENLKSTIDAMLQS